MAKTYLQKQEVVLKTQDNIKNSKLVIFTDYSGMNVEDMTKLRSRLLENNDKYQVIKNALIDIASQKENYKTNIKESKSQTAVVFGFSDEVLPAKTLVEFIKEAEKPKILGGLYEGEFISEEEVKKLATIPSREELHAKLVGTIAGPMTGMLGVLQGNLRGLVSVLNQYHQQIKNNK
jgi:large subunit ribosomal protein L10